jgi:hypothetical protein
MGGLGAMQGVSFHDGKTYLYGDVWDANPRVGVIREYTAGYKPTGRVVWLRQADKPLLRHPTGLTWHSRWGTFLGDTVNHKAVIYRIDWKKAWEDGNLDRAVPISPRAAARPSTASSIPRPHRRIRSSRRASPLTPASIPGQRLSGSVPCRGPIR